MRVFEPRDDLRFGLKAADELGMIGILRQDNLDRDRAADAGLLCAIDCAKAAYADPLAELVALNNASARLWTRCSC
jgi:hypothetical protein